GELLDRALETKDLPAGLRQRAADAYMLLGQNSKAIDLYVKLVQEYPQSIPIRERLADLFLQSRDAKKAAEHMEALIREEPGKYPQAYLILGNIAMQEGKFKEAEDHLRKAVVLTPKNEPAYYDLAVAQINGGRAREGLETLDEARGRFRDTFQTEFFAGIAHSRLKEYSNAVHRFTSAEVIAAARDTNRLTHLFYFQLGASHERNKDLDAAERYFRKSLAIAPGFAEALNYLGYMWAEAGIRLKEALPLIEKAVELEPKNAAFLDSLAWVHFKLGDPKEAMVWMKKCIEHSAEPDPTLFDHLGDIHAALGNLKEAAGAWKKSIEIEPSSPIETKLKDAEKRLSSP
ncbi:MAG: tetratricopeptide repeat protein, partial [Verrucomicrobia bacterium]|nr:tetratricopeptide repeat protein [Verrucomicrobiota bacterium]